MDGGQLRRRQQLDDLVASAACLRAVFQLHALLLKVSLLHHPRYLLPLLRLSSLSPFRSLPHSLSLLLSTPTAFLSLPHFLPLISSFSLSIHPHASLYLFNLAFRSSVLLHNLTYPSLLRACARSFSATQHSPFISKGLELHCRALIAGHCSHEYTMNSLMSMYAKFGFVGDARRVFGEMEARTAASWNVLMAMYDGVGEWREAEKVFFDMPERSVTSWNSRLSRYMRKGDWAGARRVFDEMPERDEVSWGSLISGFASARRYKDALELFREMRKRCVRPTELTIVSVLGVCAETGELELGREIHRYLNDEGIIVDGFIGNAMLDMYAKCGDLISAREVFDGIAMKHTTNWNAMIVGLSVHGCSDEALKLFSAMEQEAAGRGAMPDRVTFIGVLSACSRNGLVKEGQMYFYKMIEHYKIEADIKHYGCMVDLFCRYGMVAEAYQTIKEMPIKANLVLWKTVISACREHGYLELAEKAFIELQRVAPPGDEELLTMSNVYAGAGRWSSVNNLRKKIIDCRAGISHAEVAA